MPLQAAMKRGPGQVRDRGLQGIESIIERQQCVSAKRDNNRFPFARQDCGMRILRAGRKIGYGCSALPFGDGLLVDAVALRKRSQALLTILYCSTDRLCRPGAAVKYLSQSASFRALELIPPSISRSNTKDYGQVWAAAQAGAWRLTFLVACGRN